MPLYFKMLYAGLRALVAPKGATALIVQASNFAIEVAPW
jgi:hypothetical protein